MNILNAVAKNYTSEHFYFLGVLFRTRIEWLYEKTKLHNSREYKVPDPGEELVGEYLKNILDCEFVEYNLQTPDVQGEIDVIGIDVEGKKLYVCEVATHLQGLQYSKRKDGRTGPDNVDRFISKFRKNIPYAEKYFSDYCMRFMIWSPVVRVAGSDAKHNPIADLDIISDVLEKELGYKIEAVVN